MNSDAAKKERKGERNLSVGGAALILLVVFATIILTIRAGVGTNMALLLGAFEAMIACLLLRKPWQDVQNPIIEFMSGTLVVIIILIDVGVMVGAWIIGGTVPSLMYYGLKLITPALVVPMAFLLYQFWFHRYHGDCRNRRRHRYRRTDASGSRCRRSGGSCGGQNVSYVGQYKSVFWCNWRRSV